MLIYICDRCGKTCGQVIHINVEVKKTALNYETWRDHDMDGKDFCQKCFDEIAFTANNGVDVP